ncbi:FAD:protein FMN transferase [Noviherbaspirillum galbum]|uniref:FAD:protein FMN transferase n=1 Tax=Noviherbaspirillum galbum TaxID=2709383 RepID=A0A6B3SPQ7_9BURK|nr:FAD:protein FMN transferase [Noviherbaspirillum galbum]NEX62814.1 FAD:protein FMN transferase [Noviherbaspirillum galbum]
MIRRAQPWLGTLVEITIPDGAADALDAVIAAAFGQVRLVHERMSFHDRESDVSRINRAPAGSSVPVDAHTLEVLRLADAIHHASGGVFDIACGMTLSRWGYLPAPDEPATGGASAGPALGLEDDGKVRKLREAWIDLGGIAKGYAVDLAAEALLAAGVSSACINAGGDLRVIGDTPFPVLVRSPQAPSRIARELMLADTSLASSGSYFSRKRHGDGWVSALIDGRSGAPLDGPVSASVLAPRCAVADALTKVLLATNDPAHPIFKSFQAEAILLGDSSAKHIQA